jgi:DNA-binding transcriptional MerR regulator
VGEQAARGNDADSNRGVEAPSGWVGTQQAARTLGVSPRTVRWHIEQGNLVAKPEGEGVRRSWLVSIDSLQAFRQTRQAATYSPQDDRTSAEGADIAAEMLGYPIRELADRLAEEAARAAEYRVRLELTEQAQSSLEEELAAERVRREQAELERDELRRMLADSSKGTEAPDTAAEQPYSSTHAPPEAYGTSPQEAEESLHPRSWWRKFFGLE